MLGIRALYIYIQAAHIYIYVYLFIYMCVCVWLCIYIYICDYVCMCVYIYVYDYVYIYMSVWFILVCLWASFLQETRGDGADGALCDCNGIYNDTKWYMDIWDDVWLYVCIFRILWWLMFYKHLEVKRNSNSLKLTVRWVISGGQKKHGSRGHRWDHEKRVRGICRGSFF